MEVCPHCKQPLPVGSDLPIAHRVWGLTFVSRQVCWVEGHPGLWSTRRDHDEPNAPSIFVQYDLTNRRGRVKTQTLYRLMGLSEEVGKALASSDATRENVIGSLGVDED